MNILITAAFTFEQNFRSLLNCVPSIQLYNTVFHYQSAYTTYYQLYLRFYRINTISIQLVLIIAIAKSFTNRTEFWVFVKHLSQMDLKISNHTGMFKSIVPSGLICMVNSRYFCQSAHWCLKMKKRIVWPGMKTLFRETSQDKICAKYKRKVKSFHITILSL